MEARPFRYNAASCRRRYRPSRSFEPLRVRSSCGVQSSCARRRLRPEHGLCCRGCCVRSGTSVRVQCLRCVSAFTPDNCRVWRSLSTPRLPLSPSGCVAASAEVRAYLQPAYVRSNRRKLRDVQNSKRKPRPGRPGLTDRRRGVGVRGIPPVRIYVDGGFAVGASSFSRQGSPRSLSCATV
jgi:hypothetical protein